MTNFECIFHPSQSVNALQKTGAGTFYIYKKRFCRTMHCGETITSHQSGDWGSRIFSRSLCRIFRSERMPSVILLLDGLNETSCDPAPLIRELNELAAMPGVCLLLSSRTPPEGLQTRLMSLSPLTQDDLSEILSGRGILMPESAPVQQMLATPLLLSMYIRSIGEDGVRIESETDLMEAMLQKETDRYTENLPEHWQADTAIHYVLPAIAHEQQQKKRYVIFQSDIGEISAPQYGSSIDILSEYLEMSDVSLAQVEEWMDQIEPYAEDLHREGNSWNITTRDYSLSLWWTDQSARLVFDKQLCTFADAQYINGLHN